MDQAAEFSGRSRIGAQTLADQQFIHGFIESAGGGQFTNACQVPGNVCILLGGGAAIEIGRLIVSAITAGGGGHHGDGISGGAGLIESGTVLLDSTVSRLIRLIVVAILAENPGDLLQAIGIVAGHLQGKIRPLRLLGKEHGRRVQHPLLNCHGPGKALAGKLNVTIHAGDLGGSAPGNGVILGRLEALLDAFPAAGVAENPPLHLPAPTVQGTHGRTAGGGEDHLIHDLLGRRTDFRGISLPISASVRPRMAAYQR